MVIPCEEGLECEYELSTRLFFRIAAVAVFNFRSEGLHDLELSVFREGVVDAGTPGFEVIQLAPSPGVGGAADVCTVFSIEVFNPSVPSIRRSHDSFTVGQAADPNGSRIFVATNGGVDIAVVVDAFVVTEEVPVFAEVEAS